MATSPTDIDPVPGTPADSRRWYHRASGLYARFVSGLEFGPARYAIDALDLHPDDRVLDMGCGPGHALVEMAGRLGPNGRAIGLDFAPGMCRQARAAIAREDVGDRADVACADITVLPVRDDAVDAVVSTFVLDLLSPAAIEQTVAEMDRVLGPDGRVAVVTLAESDAVMTRLYRWLRGVFPTQLDCRPIPVATFLEVGGFDVAWARDRSLYGLPVTVVLATR